MSAGASIDDRERALLHERARDLAVVPATTPGEGELLSVVQFSLGAEVYAVENRHVREVLPILRVRSLPGVPPFVRGIINVRGRIVSLLDVRLILGLSQSALGPASCMIVLQSADMELGLIADSLVGLAGIPNATIQPMLPTLTKSRVEYLKGVTAGGLVILDAGKLLEDKRLVINDAVEGAS